jgi:polygalacturonase
MKKMQKIVKRFAICVLCLFLTLPAFSAGKTDDVVFNDSSVTNGFDRYTTCYLEISGDISQFDWPRIIGSNFWKTTWSRIGDDRAVVSFWSFVLVPDASIRIYSEKNGDLLWEHQGTNDVQMRLFGYAGIYIYEDSGSDEGTGHVTINGYALFANVRLR